MVPLSAYVAVSAVLFITGLLGVLIRRNFIIVLMSVEIMLNAANINLVAFSYYLESMAGQMVALFVIAIAAGEAAIGLAIIIVLSLWYARDAKLRLVCQPIFRVLTAPIKVYAAVAGAVIAVIAWPFKKVWSGVMRKGANS